VSNFFVKIFAFTILYPMIYFLIFKKAGLFDALYQPVEKGEEMKYRKILDDSVYVREDPARPGWHLTTPSHYMIDCWGAVFHNGYYHMFVDVNPERDEPGEEIIFWHVRSKDLLNWEHLPQPMLPDENEIRTNDGWIGLDDHQVPVLLYTSVPKPPDNLRTHRAAIGDKNLLKFTRIPGDPFLTLNNHGGPSFCGGWSDPYVFDVNGKRYLTISKCIQTGGGDPLPVYEAVDGSLLNWKYLGELFEHNGEVVNFFPLGEKWVLIYSPYQAIEVFVGTLDTEAMKFMPEQHRILSYGYHSQQHPVDRGFYATCVYRLKERTVLCGWISGLNSTELWDGCMGVPRELSISNEFAVIQKPIREILSLREKDTVIEITSDTEVAFYDMADMELECRFMSDEGYLKISIGDFLTILMKEKEVISEGDVYPMGYRENHARILLDKTLCEMFFGNSKENCGSVSATRCFPFAGKTPKLKVESSCAEYRIRSWRMKETVQTFSEELAKELSS